MDRSYLSDPEVVGASRDFVCVRLVTYEDVEEMEFMKSIYDFRTPTKNSLFAILDPSAEEHLVEPAAERFGIARYRGAGPRSFHAGLHHVQAARRR